MESTPNIHVGILLAEEIKFRLIGKYKAEDKDLYCYAGCAAIAKNGKIHIENGGNEIVLEDEITFLPCNIAADQFEIEDVVIGIDFHWEQKENQKFQGALKLKIIEDKIQVINILPVENYLFSVISSEMSANSSLNLLKAHTIISRSWLLAQIEKQDQIRNSSSDYEMLHQNEEELIRWYDREDHSEFHVCADDHCQRYQGITRAHNPNVIAAVNETSGEVLCYENAICDARFSKCCGGVTELFENCWEEAEHPYLQKVIDADKTQSGYAKDLTIETNATEFITSSPDAFCNTDDEQIISQVLNDYDQSSNDFYRWKVEYAQKDISKLIKEKSGIDFGDIKKLEPVERGTSGRLVKLKIEGTKKTLIVGKELEIRRWLSPSHLYSSAFKIAHENHVNDIPQKFILEGAGWGHGVGLCQIGAAVMGEKGYNHKEILMHYFIGASIDKAY